VRLGRRWEDIIKINLKYRGREDVDRIHLAQDADHMLALVNVII